MPYGWTLAEDGTHLEADDREQAIIGAARDLREEGLNISEALVSANAAAVPAISPNGTVIGWWAWEADIFVTPPTKTLDLAGRETSFKVSPAEFVGYTGTWYLLNSSNGKAATDSHGNPIPLFLVTDPSLDIRIWDLDVNAAG